MNAASASHPPVDAESKADPVGLVCPIDCPGGSPPPPPHPPTPSHATVISHQAHHQHATHTKDPRAPHSADMNGEVNREQMSLWLGP